MKKLLLAAAAAVVIAAAYTTLWFVGADRLEAAVAEWRANAQARGVTVSHDEVRIGGFPLALTATLTNLEMTAPDGMLVWHASTVRVRTQLWDLDRIAYDASGKHWLTVTRQGQTQQVGVEARSATGEVVTRKERREDHFRAEGLRFQGEDVIVAIEALEGTGFDDKRPAATDAESFGLRYDLTGLSVTDRLGVRMFEPAIDRLGMEMAATGPFLRIFDSGSLVDWADAGGVLTLRDLALEWNGLSFAAKGSGRLDPQLRPAGAITFTSVGFAEGLDALEAKAALPPEFANFVRQLAEPFLTPADGAGKSQLVVPVTAADGILSVGEHALTQVPSLKSL